MNPRAEPVLEDRVIQRLLAEHARELVFRYRFEPEEGFAYISPASRVLLGHTAEDVYARPELAAVLARPEDRPLLEAAWRGPATRSLPSVIEVTLPDRSSVWLEVRRSPVFDEHGKLLAIDGVVLDITDRRRAEERLRETLRQLQGTLDALPARVAILDGNGVVVAINEAWRHASGPLGTPEPNRDVGVDYPARCEEVTGRNQAKAHGLAQGIRDVLRRRATMYSAEYTLGEGEQQRWFRVRVVPTSTGESGAVVVHDDITGLKLADQARVLARERLDEIHRLREEQQAREIEQLREMAKFKTELLNTASHELNTPLTALRIQVDILKSMTAPDMPERQARSFRVIDRSIDRIIRLVTDMLDVARLDSGRLALNCGPVPLQALVVDCVETLADTAKQREVALVARPFPDLVVNADGQRAAQVLLNLVANAIKFTPEGGQVEVAVHQEGAFARIEVRDTGIGLLPDQMARLFQPFSQVHESAEHRRGGTGLGLYISKGLVEQHGGRIGCQSGGLGRGSTFFFTLPLVASPPGVVVQD